MLMGMLFDLTMSVVTLKLPFLVHTISKKDNLYKFYLDNNGKNQKSTRLEWFKFTSS